MHVMLASFSCGSSHAVRSKKSTLVSSQSTTSACAENVHLSRHARLKSVRAASSSTGLDSLLVHTEDVTSKVLGVVIVDHGSRRKESNEMLTEFGELYASVSGRTVVEIAHMEIANPSILDALTSCSKRGATHVIVAPYFLSRGRHIQTDIPALVEEAKTLLPSLHVEIAEPIGAPRPGL